MLHEAVETMEKLRKKRFTVNSDGYKIADIIVSNHNELLKFIREERRRQLIFRGLRWTDIRRYNMEDGAESLRRVLDDKTYTLMPNDKRYAFLVPSLIMGYNPDMVQNPR